MKAQIVEQVELFTEAELESLEFVPEELEAIEQERVPNLENISFEDIAEDLEAIFMSFEDIAEASYLVLEKRSFKDVVKDVIRRFRRQVPKLTLTLPTPPPSRPPSPPPSYHLLPPSSLLQPPPRRSSRRGSLRSNRSGRASS